ncbi:MAG: HelD family protein [Acidimicrobiales bacterium]
MSHEREIAEEQSFLDVALGALDHMRAEATSLRDSVAVAHRRGAGDLVERDVVMGTALQRLDQLAIGDQPLFFGRIDYRPNVEGRADSYHVGRLAVSDEDLNPLVVDWRAPVAEAFYRATGVEPLNLARRRHVAIRAHEVTGVEDEYFTDEGAAWDDTAARALNEEGLVEGGLALGGAGALLAALGRARSGRMADIVATIQSEQDQIIRSPLAGVLLVQGGPGTGKTAVALHRAAYLLYTHRATLERQGVLVVGPNPLFLHYIENVLPSLGESGVRLSTIAGLVANIVVRGHDSDELAALKGDRRMATFLSRALATRQRALRHDVVIPVGRARLILRAVDTRDAVERARRRPGNHNQRRSALVRELAQRLAQAYRARVASGGAGDDEDELATLGELADQIRATGEFKEAMQRVWPRLSGAELLHDLFGAPALIEAAGRGLLSEDEQRLLFRARSASLEDVAWTAADAALIDEARVLLGPRRRPRTHVRPAESALLEGIDLDAYRGDIRAAALREAARLAVAAPPEPDEAEFVTYGHIVVDEAQDLSAMEWRALRRRDLNGSMTIVGDMGQATTAASAASWETVLAMLEPRRPPTRVDLSVSYRTPAEVLDFAAATLRAASPDLTPPRPVRRAGSTPSVEVVAPGELAATLVGVVRRELAAVSPGRVAVIADAGRVRAVRDALVRAGLDAVDPTDDASSGLSSDLVVVAAQGANGLEFDAVVVVDPAEIARRATSAVNARGLRTLYVAMTRPTRRLALVSDEPLPPSLL